MANDIVPVALFSLLFGSLCTCLLFFGVDLLWRRRKASLLRLALGSHSAPKVFELYEDRYSGWRCIVLRCRDELVWYVVRGDAIAGVQSLVGWHRDWIRVLP